MAYLSEMTVDEAVQELKDSMSDLDLMTQSAVAAVLKEFQDYQKLEKKGLLLELPYAIGTPIYKVCYSEELNNGFVHETIMGLKFYADNIKEFEKELIYDDKDAANEKLEKMKKGNTSEN